MPYKDPAEGKAYRHARYMANRDRHLGYMKLWYAANKEHVARRDFIKHLTHPDRRRNQHLRRYGLTKPEWDVLFETQGSRCACCGATDPGNRKIGWQTDHDHKTNRVRGILCHPCNSMLAHTSTPERLAKGIDYLKRNATEHLDEMLA